MYDDGTPIFQYHGHPAASQTFMPVTLVSLPGGNDTMDSATVPLLTTSTQRAGAWSETATTKRRKLLPSPWRAALSRASRRGMLGHAWNSERRSFNTFGFSPSPGPPYGSVGGHELGMTSRCTGDQGVQRILRHKTHVRAVYMCVAVQRSCSTTGWPWRKVRGGARNRQLRVVREGWPEHPSTGRQRALSLACRRRT